MDHGEHVNSGRRRSSAAAPGGGTRRPASGPPLRAARSRSSSADPLSRGAARALRRPRSRGRARALVRHHPVRVGECAQDELEGVSVAALSRTPHGAAGARAPSRRSRRAHAGRRPGVRASRRRTGPGPADLCAPERRAEQSLEDEERDEASRCGHRARAPPGGALPGTSRGALRGDSPAGATDSPTRGQRTKYAVPMTPGPGPWPGA